ncbi:MAG TPA: CHAT domain-containing protein, partial [Gemmatimonadaceae bacterium]|nr:CHAT domain-containing protein [Gemmatimonadaceae bacterium]
YAAAQLDRPAEAAELAEIGRARWLDQAIQLAAVRGSALSADIKAAVDEAHATVLELERRELELLGQGVTGAVRDLENYFGIAFGTSAKVRLTADPHGEEAKTRAELAEVRARLQSAHENLCRLLNSISDDNLLSKRPGAAQIKETARQAGFPIAYLLSSVWGSVAIMVREEVEVVPLPGLLRSAVQDLLYGGNGYISLLAEPTSQRLDASLRAIQATLDAHVFPPLTAWCRDTGTTAVGVIGLGDFGLLPIQVSSVPAGLDLHVLPSARALRLSLDRRQSHDAETKSLLTIGDPGSDGLRPLPFAGVESSVISALFKTGGASVTDLSTTPTVALVEQELSSVTHVHLACHGTFRPFSPLNSVVHLGGSEQLQVERLLRPALKLVNAQLVILSACNSASGERLRTPDEAIGFPAAVLAAGARTVVAAQWEVSDAVTLLLIHRFCREVLAGASAARALANAQRWLMGVGVTEIGVAIDQMQSSLAEEPRSRRLLEEFKNEIGAMGTAVPFADPSYWAGFVCVGA